MTDSPAPLTPDTAIPDRSYAASPVSFREAVKSGLTRWTMKGRASRSEFWYFVLALFVLNAAVMLVSINVSPDLGGALLLPIVMLFSAVTLLMVAVRRYHDSGKSGRLLAGSVAASAVAGMFVVGSGLVGGLATLGADGKTAADAYATMWGAVAAIVALTIVNIVVLSWPGQAQRNAYDS